MLQFNFLIFCHITCFPKHGICRTCILYFFFKFWWWGCFAFTVEILCQDFPFLKVSLEELRIELDASFPVEGTGTVKLLFSHLFRFHLVFVTSSHCFLILSQSLPGKINDQDCLVEKNSVLLMYWEAPKKGKKFLALFFCPHFCQALLTTLKCSYLELLSCMQRCLSDTQGSVVANAQEFHECIGGEAGAWAGCACPSPDFTPFPHDLQDLLLSS